MERSDILVFKQGLCASREDAKKLIMAGKVRAGRDAVVMKPSEKYSEDTEFIVEQPSPYVSRGAYKLLDSLEKYLPDLSGMTALDVGASTGGFTDLMLQKNATKVYAVDSGHGQLHDKLRNDPRVISMEKANARYLDELSIPEKIDIMTMDVSFISVMKIIPATDRLLKPGALAFILVKPQFELERKDVGKGGVVRDDALRQKAVDKICSFARDEMKWKLLEVLPSSIKGPKGNQEYMAVFVAGKLPPA
ncbi:MAG: hemolysin [Lentisphaerae bacterium GWF2_45_14]|nr:MAG: hemolysin [Lentisphaerae bacterium GWF2_45_14]